MKKIAFLVLSLSAAAWAQPNYQCADQTGHSVVQLKIAPGATAAIVSSPAAFGQFVKNPALRAAANAVSLAGEVIFKTAHAPQSSTLQLSLPLAQSAAQGMMSIDGQPYLCKVQIPFSMEDDSRLPCCFKVRSPVCAFNCQA